MLLAGKPHGGAPKMLYQAVDETLLL